MNVRTCQSTETSSNAWKIVKLNNICLSWQWQVWEISTNIYFIAQSQNFDTRDWKPLQKVIEEKESNESRISIATGGIKFSSILLKHRYRPRKFYNKMHEMFQVNWINLGFILFSSTAHNYRKTSVWFSRSSLAPHPCQLFSYDPDYFWIFRSISIQDKVSDIGKWKLNSSGINVLNFPHPNRFSPGDVIRFVLSKKYLSSIFQIKKCFVIVSLSMRHAILSAE